MDTNSLVADVVDNTSAISDAYLLQDANDIAQTITSGDWAAGALAITSGALNTIGAMIDPLGTFIANGLGWVLDHVEPLKTWFNDFTGDAAEVASFSTTWMNVSSHLNDTAVRYQSSLRDLDGMSGAIIEAYLTHANLTIQHIHSAGGWSEAMANGLQLASSLIQMVHDIIRDVLSQLVGAAISVAATTAATVGFGAPAAMTQFGVKVEALVARVGRIVPRVIETIRELARLLERLPPTINRAITSAREFIRHGGGDTPPIRPAVGTPSARIPTRQEFDDYVTTLSTRGPNYGSPDARDFQSTHAGTSEYKIGIDDDKVWADGLRYDPRTGGVVVEAKFVENPAAHPSVKAQPPISSPRVRWISSTTKSSAMN